MIWKEIKCVQTYNIGQITIKSEKKEIFSGTIRMLLMSPYYIYLHFEWTHICHMGPFRTQAFEHCYDGYWWERELPYLRNRLNSQLRTGGQGRAYNTMWKNTIVNYAWNTKGNSQYFHQRITEWEQKYFFAPREQWSVYLRAYDNAGEVNAMLLWLWTKTMQMF